VASPGPALDERPPDVTVVVPSHGRRLRLRWLLNALEEQSLPPHRWEVVVVHDYGDREAQDLFRRHPIMEGSRLRHIQIAPGTGSPARQRNLGWRAAHASLVAFTDDDCRPDARWLERLLEEAARRPGAIVQGATRSDPLEVGIWAGPHTRSVSVSPPGPFAQTCNILYPKSVLEQVGGFDERFTRAVGEDLDLALRARAAGAPLVGAPGALVFHAVESYPLPRMLALNAKWADTALLVKRHPQLRRRYTLGIFWRVSHFKLSLALLGVTLGRRHAPLAALALPYVRDALETRGTHARGRVAAAAELPGRVTVDLFEMLTLIRGSWRYRTIVL
jgi:GT2 family glycosyltransferase